MSVMVYAYGSRRTGKWVVIGEAEVALGASPATTSDVFEAYYIVPKKSPEDYGKWQAAFYLFGAENFNLGLRKTLAFEMGVPEDRLKILWWQYNNETEPASFTLQVKYIPEEVGALPARVGIIGWFALFGSMAVVTYIASLFAFSPEPKLNILKYLLEQVNIALRWTFYLIIAGGSVYLLAKLLPKLLEKKTETKKAS